MSSEPSELPEPPRLLTYTKMVEDLSSIPINETDILFEKFAGDSPDADINSTTADQLYERLKKFILFKSNLALENQDLKSDFSLNNLGCEFEELENRLGSLQHFIDISKKFFSIDKK